MIFVTVGSVFPFDRLVAAADAWAESKGVRPPAQIGRSKYRARSLDTVESQPNCVYRAAVAGCNTVVAHAGMGSILTAAEFGKPIVVMPRRASLNEHTTDHQMDTAAWLRNRHGIFVAMTSDEVSIQIDAAISAGRAPDVNLTADPVFINRLREQLMFYARDRK